MSEQATCHRPGCEEVLRPSRGARARKWCSEYCRKLALYSRECVDCGRPCNVDGRATNAAERCGPCNVAFQAAAAHADKEAWVRVALVMRAQGRPNREIAEEVGRDFKTVQQTLYELRRDGADVPCDPYMTDRRSTGAGNVKVTSEVLERCCSLYASGMTAAEVAAREGLHRSTVSHLVHGKGLR